MLTDAGHAVAAMTRSAGKAEWLASMGAQSVVCDVFGRPALRSALRGFPPDLVLHQLTDLPDDLADLPQEWPLNTRLRTEGTCNTMRPVQQLYGPGIYYQGKPPPRPLVNCAAARTFEALDAPAVS